MSGNEALEMSPEQSDMAHLGLATKRIAALRDELKSWQDEYDKRLQAILDTAPKFTDSKFLKGVHKKGQMYKADGIGIIRSTRTSRKLRQSEFAERYPEEFRAFASIGLTDADNSVGKDRVAELCDLDTSYTYKVIDLTKPDGE